MTVGALLCLGLLSVLFIPLLLAVVILAIALAAARRQLDAALLGLIAGFGLPALVVGYLNRDGPGPRCTVSATAGHCVDQLSPWPWVVVGLLLLSGGVAAFVVVRYPRHR